LHGCWLYRIRLRLWLRLWLRLGCTHTTSIPPSILYRLVQETKASGGSSRLYCSSPSIVPTVTRQCMRPTRQSSIYHVEWVIVEQNLDSRVLDQKMSVPGVAFKHVPNTQPSVETFSRRSNLEKMGRTWLLGNVRLETMKVMGQDLMSLSLHGDLDWSIQQRSKMPGQRS
jgi:hypothetical protein